MASNLADARLKTWPSHGMRCLHMPFVAPGPPTAMKAMKRPAQAMKKATQAMKTKHVATIATPQAMPATTQAMPKAKPKAKMKVIKK